MVFRDGSCSTSITKDFVLELCSSSWNSALSLFFFFPSALSPRNKRLKPFSPKHKLPTASMALNRPGMLSTPPYIIGHQTPRHRPVLGWWQGWNLIPWEFLLVRAHLFPHPMCLLVSVLIIWPEMFCGPLRKGKLSWEKRLCLIWRQIFGGVFLIIVWCGRLALSRRSWVQAMRDKPVCLSSC